jgi:1-deoxy-D-xylulose-5-phosphate reductoisomerase
MAGDLVLRAAAEGGGELVPIDSEHSAVLQCVTGHPESLARLTLTASGGPFRDWPVERVRTATVAEALRHPTWQMGRKITVDSASLANKALEVIEAHFLFGLPYDAIEVVVHPQSIVHGLVEFVDGSILAQVGHPSMELPILYALSHPERVADAGVRRFDPVAQGLLTFEAVRRDAFPTFDLGVAAGRTGGTAPAVFNAANEAAVAAFLDGRIPFGRIPELIDAALSAHAPQPADDLETIRGADRAARARVAEDTR